MISVFIIAIFVTSFVNDVPSQYLPDYGPDPESISNENTAGKRVTVTINPLETKKEPLLPELARDYFEAYVTVFNKRYKTKKAYEDHLNVFKSNLEEINSLNEQSTSIFHINRFTDETFENFTNKFTGFNSSMVTDSPESYTPVGNRTPRRDWRRFNYITPVGNQLRCKSSYVFSAIGNIEAMYAMEHLYPAQSFSVLQGYDCETTGSCEYGGVPHLVMQALMDKGGVVLTDIYPYTERPKKKNCDNVSESDMVAKIASVRLLSVADENDLADIVANEGPVATTMFASLSVKHYRAGILDPKDCDESTNHAVLLVGYGEVGNVTYWIIKNSWGMDWGESGYLRLIRGRNACNLGTEYVATVTMENNATQGNDSNSSNTTSTEITTASEESSSNNTNTTTTITTTISSSEETSATELTSPTVTTSRDLLENLFPTPTYDSAEIIKAIEASMKKQTRMMKAEGSEYDETASWGIKTTAPDLDQSINSSSEEYESDEYADTPESIIQSATTPEFRYTRIGPHGMDY